MKDYRLSEIKDICEQQGSCDDCECADVCHRVHKYKFIPNEWDDIEPRDMIELPCKEQWETVQGLGIRGAHWRVYFLDKYNTVQHNYFDSESEADAFLAELKGGKK